MRKLIFLNDDKRIGVFTVPAHIPSNGTPYAVIDFYDSSLTYNFTARLKNTEELYALYGAIGEALDALCPGLVSPLPDGEENPEVESIKKKASGLVYA
jgi:hypothetical protein